MYRVDVFAGNKQNKREIFQIFGLELQPPDSLKVSDATKIGYIPSTISRAVIKRKMDYLNSSSANANFEGEKRREFIFFVVMMVALFSMEEEPFDVMT